MESGEFVAQTFVPAMFLMWWISLMSTIGVSFWILFFMVFVLSIYLGNQFQQMSEPIENEVV